MILGVGINFVRIFLQSTPSMPGALTTRLNTAYILSLTLPPIITIPLKTFMFVNKRKAQIAEVLDLVHDISNHYKYLSSVQFAIFQESLKAMCM
jgi:hypothetical protein